MEYITVVRRMNDMELSTHVGSPPSNRGFTTTPSPARRQASLVDAAAGNLLSDSQLILQCDIHVHEVRTINGRTVRTGKVPNHVLES
jgi:hypothetical protein